MKVPKLKRPRIVFHLFRLGTRSAGMIIITGSSRHEGAPVANSCERQCTPKAKPADAAGVAVQIFVDNYTAVQQVATRLFAAAREPDCRWLARFVTSCRVRPLARSVDVLRPRFCPNCFICRGRGELRRDREMLIRRRCRRQQAQRSAVNAAPSAGCTKAAGAVCDAEIGNQRSLRLVSDRLFRRSRQVSPRLRHKTFYCSRGARVK